jgi:hypothetical protein
VIQDAEHEGAVEPRLGGAGGVVTGGEQAPLERQER